MDPNIDAGRPVPSFSSARDLEVWLTQRGLPMDLWGRAGAKRVEDLHTELQNGDSTLLDEPPRRYVAFIQLLIEANGLYLYEARQILASGAVRERATLPAEKLKPGESWVDAARRCLSEELGLGPGAVYEVVRVDPYRQEEAESPSYPGLQTAYVVRRAQVAAQGLPRTAFSTMEASTDGDPSVSQHFWEWRSHMG